MIQVFLLYHYYFIIYKSTYKSTYQYAPTNPPVVAPTSQPTPLPTTGPHIAAPTGSPTTAARSKFANFSSYDRLFNSIESDHKPDCNSDREPPTVCWRQFDDPTFILEGVSYHHSEDSDKKDDWRFTTYHCVFIASFWCAYNRVLIYLFFSSLFPVSYYSIL